MPTFNEPASPNPEGPFRFERITAVPTSMVTMSKGRVAVVVTAFPTVSETFIFNKVIWLCRAGYEVTVLTGRESRAASFFEMGALRQAGVSVHIVPTAHRKVALALYACAAVLSRPRVTVGLLRAAWRGKTDAPLRRVRKWLKALPFSVKPFDIIHFEFSGLAISYLDVIPLLRPSAIIVSCRGTAEQVTPLVQPERGNALHQLFTQVDRIHCVSEDMGRTVVRFGIPPGKLFVNRPAINPHMFRRDGPYARQRGELQLVSTGRLHWDKGFVYAIIAVRELLDSGYPVRYSIIGEGPDRRHLTYTISQLQLEKVVTLEGAKSSVEVRASLERADIFLLPTVREGISNACLEAMACGVPVISTSAGGMAEVIRPYVDGLLVPPRSPNSIAAAVRECFDSPALTERLSAGALARIDAEFTLERQAAVFVREYDRLLKGTRGRDPILADACAS